MVIEQERPGTRTIWEDNYRGFNYRLFFEDTADENAPERVTLVKRTENIPTEEILWTFDFCSVDKMEAAFSTLNNMLAALSEFVDTKCSIKTFAFVESYPDFTETPLKNGTLVATVTKNGSDVLTPTFEVVNGNVFSNSVALEWTKDFASFLTVNDGVQFIVCIGTEPKLEAVSDYTVALSYTSDKYIEDYVKANSGVMLNGFVKSSTGSLDSSNPNYWNFNNGYRIGVFPNIFDGITLGNLASHGKVVTFNFYGTIKTTSNITNIAPIVRFTDSKIAVISANALVNMPDGKTVYPLQPTFMSQDVQFFAPGNIDLKGGKIQAYVTFIDYNYVED